MTQVTATFTEAELQGAFSGSRRAVSELTALDAERREDLETAQEVLEAAKANVDAAQEALDKAQAAFDEAGDESRTAFKGLKAAKQAEAFLESLVKDLANQTSVAAA